MWELTQHEYTELHKYGLEASHLDTEPFKAAAQYKGAAMVVWAADTLPRRSHSEAPLHVALLLYPPLIPERLRSCAGRTHP